MIEPVYRAGPVEGYQWLTAVGDDEHLRLIEISSHQADTAWIPPRTALLRTDDNGKPLEVADLPWYLGGTLVLSPRSRELLEPILAPAGEFLPLAGEAGDHVVFNATHYTDALDEPASELTRFPDGRILRIKRVVLGASAFADAPAVRLANVHNSPIFYSHGVVQAINELGLTGTTFKPCGECRS